MGWVVSSSDNSNTSTSACIVLGVLPLLRHTLVTNNSHIHERELLARSTQSEWNFIYHPNHTLAASASHPNLIQGKQALEMANP